jgi:hypothetical protein
MRNYLPILLTLTLLVSSCKREQTPEEPDHILAETTVGVYGLSGENHVYIPVECQLSRTYDAQGTLTLRILRRADGGVCQVSQIKADAAKGDSFQVGILLKNEQETVLNSTTEVDVLEVGESLLWLKAKEGALRMVIKK